MRVYLPTTLSGLAALVATGEIGPSPLTGYAVTAALREWYPDADVEELEYLALGEAAGASLRMLLDRPVPPRRVVLAADVPDAVVVAAPLVGRAAVHVDQAVPRRRVAAGHLDDADAEAAVSAAVGALSAADAGEPRAVHLVDEAEAYELLWYAGQELDDLVTSGAVPG
ncbi:MAG: DUF6912 family protein [Actinomycetes bacterium]